MHRRFFSPNGILAEIVALFLILGICGMGMEKKDALEGRRVNSDSVHSRVGTGTKSGDRKSDDDQEKSDYIKWVDFDVTAEAMRQAYDYDVKSCTQENHVNWVDLLAYLGAKYGGDFSRYKTADMKAVTERILDNGEKIEVITEDMQYFPYYREAYGAVLDGMVGEYKMEVPEVAKDGSTAADEKKTDSMQKTDDATSATGKIWKKFYGLKAFNPIAKGFPYSDYDDFGVSRSYGYRRNHLGHDMMGQVGTPVIAVESGVVAILGWNQYGGWRIGINSFDGKRYYYYAHLRQNRPYAEGLKEGDIVQAGDVIGYIGRTGYSAKENVNNIDEYHLHFGLQLIFDESQREGNNEIWVNGYELVKFLSANRSEVQRNDATKEWTRVYRMKDSAAEEYLRKNGKRD